ncbi:hypothetical protein MUK42_37441 [Musa troglodytarum]|uniref:Uncharacterized protein n=1 Tax=Musa troglodytarum TaxID=320322 RepID=A0A9E7FGA6_9LILI|nr:hypothetical protein MUK42_37441 [Musa troglodytarum]
MFAMPKAQPPSTAAPNKAKGITKAIFAGDGGTLFVWPQLQLWRRWAYHRKYCIEMSNGVRDPCTRVIDAWAPQHSTGAQFPDFTESKSQLPSSTLPTATVIQECRTVITGVVASVMTKTNACCTGNPNLTNICAMANGSA